jgi:hypothetical protein
MQVYPLYKVKKGFLKVVRELFVFHVIVFIRFGFRLYTRGIIVYSFSKLRRSRNVAKLKVNNRLNSGSLRFAINK